MRIKKIRIQNFRSIEDIEIDFSDKLNVFVGINGSGKTSVLDALSTSLTWLVNRIQRLHSNGSTIKDEDIRYESRFSSIELLVEEGGNGFSWKTLRAARGSTVLEKSDLSEVSDLAFYFQERSFVDEMLPVIAYYPVSRVVDSTSPVLGNKDNLYILDVYDNALNGKRNYQSFFEWFRKQDDILNEKAMSRTKWMQQNKPWIHQRVGTVIASIRESFPINESKKKHEEFSYRIERLLNDKFFFEEPRILFHELSRLIEFFGREGARGAEEILHDLDRMFHRMERYSHDYQYDIAAKADEYEEMLIPIIRDFREMIIEVVDLKFLKVVWEIFAFANILSLWWISATGRKKLDRIFIEFYPDYIQKPFFIDETLRALPSHIKQIISSELEQKKKAFRSEGKELMTVAKAIEQFVPDYSSLRVKRIPRPHMMINKGGQEYNLDHLSDGEKNLITLVGDIARRLAIANPHADEPLHGSGVILIDEIDMHLHPKWQRLMIPQLQKVFPNCQFIITTHSPQIISHIRPESLFLFEQKDNKLVFKKIKETYGMSIERVVENVMDDEARPFLVQKKIDTIFELIEFKELLRAKQLISELKVDMSHDPELMRAEMLIRKEELRNEANNK